MTPSLPTFFMASAMMLPMVESLLAEMVPTCAIISPETGLLSFLTSSTATSTAFSMPRLRAIWCRNALLEIHSSETPFVNPSVLRPLGQTRDRELLGLVALGFNDDPHLGVVAVNRQLVDHLKREKGQRWQRDGTSVAGSSALAVAIVLENSRAIVAEQMQMDSLVGPSTRPCKRKGLSSSDRGPG
jgi:hypothetical protein